VSLQQTRKRLKNITQTLSPLQGKEFYKSATKGLRCSQTPLFSLLSLSAPRLLILLGRPAINVRYTLLVCIDLSLLCFIFLCSISKNYEILVVVRGETVHLDPNILTSLGYKKIPFAEHSVFDFPVLRSKRHVHATFMNNDKTNSFLVLD
jgi:hypothetical protein